jgi:coenzyme F420-reducing hydrogenase delta subunit
MSFYKQSITCLVCDWTFSEEKPEDIPEETATVNVTRIKCIGALDPEKILEILANGIDGVLLVGCAPHDCHFAYGSFYSTVAVKVLKRLLSLTGLEPERLELRLISPTEKVDLASVVRVFSKRLQAFGHSPLTGEKPDVNILENVLAAKSAFSGFRLRAFLGKQISFARNMNVYNERLSDEELDNLIDEVVKAEFIRQKILRFAEKPVSVKELSQSLKMKPNAVLRHILNMRRRGMIALDRIEGTTPLYRALEAR